MRFSFFRRIFPLGVLCLATCALANASPVACAASGSFADLIATNQDGGCYVQDKLFSDFDYGTSVGGGAIPVDPSQFGYSIIADAPDAVGFAFNFGLTALQGQFNNITISWLVTGPNITSNHLAMAGVAQGNALALVTELYCKGGPVAGCPPGNGGALNTFSSPGVGTQLIDEDIFDPVGVLGVVKDIGVVAGQGGFAHISSLTQTVDQHVPEPATMALAGFSLLGLGVLSRRMLKRA